MSEIVLQMFQTLPNLIVAIAALAWGAAIIGRMLEHQQKLIDRLLEMASKNEALATKLTPPSP